VGAQQDAALEFGLILWRGVCLSLMEIAAIAMWPDEGKSEGNSPDHDPFVWVTVPRRIDISIVNHAG
jgi:hypothetical protein